MSSSISVVDAVEPTDSTPRESTIDVFFNLGGECGQTHQYRPQGGRHRRPLQPQWWMLPDLSTVPPRGASLTSSLTSVVDAAGPTSSALQGTRR
jgi:hypothetical protein